MAASPGSLRAGGTDATANAPPASGQPAFRALTASAPQAPLIQAGDGNFDGTTYGGAGTDLSREMRVGYSLGGQAEVGTDYITSNGQSGDATIAIPAGSARVKLKLKAVDDGTRKGSRSLEINLNPSSNGDYVVGDVTKLKLHLIDNG